MWNLLNIFSILGQLRVDINEWFKSNYGTTTGSDVKLTVNVATIAYPKPSVSLISWAGPASTGIQNEIRERGSMLYKHWITSIIPVKDETYLGNYTMIYNGEIIFTITVKQEGV
jgi:hypothetical protein